MPHENTPAQSKVIVVTGGVISGLGKGVVTASLANLLQVQGYKVAAIKIDPYINLDAGTMRPTEHGEVFVTFDGGETDQDIGTYERFLDQNISRNNNITTGQVFKSVIQQERNLEYDGRCVEVIPHIPREVERRVREVGKKEQADFVIVEVGGTSGDYQNVLFLEAFRTMKLRGDPIAFVHVVFLPVPNNLGEMKTKPAQHSVRMLNEVGIQPDFIVARAKNPLDEPRKEKLSIFCNVKPEHVVSAPDVRTIYESPLVLEKQSIVKKLLGLFGESYKEGATKKWEEFVSKITNPQKEVNIGIVGKYFDIGDFTLEDSYVSVIEAIKHASWAQDAKPVIKWIDSKKYESDPKAVAELENIDGIIVPGGFGSSGVEGKIKAIEYCREQGKPFLGLCYGLQLAVVEFARNKCSLTDASSIEFNENASHRVIDVLPDQVKKIKEKNYGGTMRLGDWKAILKQGSKVAQLYGADHAVERHRHRYEVNPEYITKLEQAGLIFSGYSEDKTLMEYCELENHPFFVGTQAHPEFTSRPVKPNPLFSGFLKACLGEIPQKVASSSQS